MGDGSRVALMAAAYLMFRWGSARSSTAINGVLGAVLPIVFVIVMAIGVSGFITKVPVVKVGLIAVGTALILYGSR